MKTLYGENIPIWHGQFNNSLFSDLLTKSYLDRLASIYDLDLFNLNIVSNIDPDGCFSGNQIGSNYYSPHKFADFNQNIAPDACLSTLHNNIRSLKRNLEDFQNHLLHELNFKFSVMGLTETRITSADYLTFNPNIPGYLFAGGVGIYLNHRLNYKVFEKNV